MQYKDQSFIHQETEQLNSLVVNRNGRDKEENSKHYAKLDGRRDFDQILRVMKRSETTHNRVQTCSKDREGRRSKPIVSQRKLKDDMQHKQNITGFQR